LDAIRKSGKADNTYIFFTADQGLAIGEHGLMGKQNLYDCSIRVPFVMVGPGIPKNKKVDADIYMQDVMPTCLELAGAKKPDFVDFNSILELARGTQNQSSYNSVYGSYINFQRMIRKDGYKLVLYPKAKKVLLYNVHEDPWEMNDLSSRPEFNEKKKMLFKELTSQQKIMNDTLKLENVFSFN
jgi:arylsulfatase A-like enzyme